MRRRVATFGAIVLVAAACGSDVPAEEADVETTSISEVGPADVELPPRFTYDEVITGLDLPVSGAGVDAATLWWLEDHPGTRDWAGALTDEQDVPQVVPTDAGDAAIGVRNGGFCFFTPTVNAVRSGTDVEVEITAPSVDLLNELEIGCSAAEQLVVISFDLQTDVASLVVDDVEVPVEPLEERDLPTDPEADEEGCLTNASTIGEAAERFVEALDRTWRGRPSPTFDRCVGEVPDVFDGVAPTCWTACPNGRTVHRSEPRIDASVNVGGRMRTELDDPDADRVDITYFATALGDDDRLVDGIERWTLLPLSRGGYVTAVDVEQPILERDTAFAALEEYLLAVGDERWEDVVLLMDDGAVEWDERDDMRSLEPDTFDLPGITAALERYCEPGCPVLAVHPDDLWFRDWGFVWRPNDRSIRIDWFEGDPYVVGVPVRSDPAS